MKNEYQAKAEKYVREKLPELIEELVTRVRTKGAFTISGMGEPFRINKPINLQHWLRVLGSEAKEWPTHTTWGRETLVLQYTNNIEIGFNLTTSQPATETDYQAFNDIVGI